MQGEIIKLAHRIFLQSEADALSYNLDTLYNACKNDLSYLGEFQNFSNLEAIPFRALKENTDKINEIYAKEFLKILSRKSPFHDLRANVFELESIDLKIESFNYRTKELKLVAYGISKEFKTIDLIGSQVFLSEADGESDWKEIFTVVLDADTTIYSLKRSKVS